MYAVFYKNKFTKQIMSPYYFTDLSLNQAKSTVIQLNIIHGHNSAKIEYISDLPMSYEELWRKDWSKL
jgi:hypothetical protein